MDSPSGEAERAEYGLGTRKCPNCKADLQNGAQFCVECGTTLATGTKIKSANSPGAKAKKRIELDPEDTRKIIYGAIAIVLIGLGYWYVYFKPHGMTEAEMKRAAQSRGQLQPGRAPKAGPLSE